MKYVPVFLTSIFLVFGIFSCKNSGKEEDLNHAQERSALSKKKAEPIDHFIQSLDSILRDTSFRNAGIGVVFMDMTTPKGRMLYSHNPDLSLVPASVIKLFTTSTALELFGGSKSFNTALQYNGTITGRNLKGNLFIRGGGDPSFVPEKVFARWIAAVKELNIDTIDGNIIGDASVFERFPIPLTWSWGELNTSYGAAASGLSIFHNTYEVKFKSGIKGPFSANTGNISPELQDLLLYNLVTEGDISEEELFITGDPYGNKKYLRGWIPRAKKEISYFASIPDPPQAAASEFEKKLVQEGITVTGKAVNLSVLQDTCTTGNYKGERTNIAFSFSPSIASLVSITNQESNNLFAEHLIKHIGLNKYHNGSEESGALAITGFWKDKGMDTGGLYIYDGCGISRYNGVTARQLVFILDYMKKSPYFTIFYNSLPLAGVTGTLRKMFRDTPAEANLRAKTGTMSRVKSLAGYIRTNTSKTIGFAVIFNNFNCSQEILKQKIEDLFARAMQL